MFPKLTTTPLDHLVVVAPCSGGGGRCPSCPGRRMEVVVGTDRCGGGCSIPLWHRGGNRPRTRQKGFRDYAFFSAAFYYASKYLHTYAGGVYVHVCSCVGVYMFIYINECLYKYVLLIHPPVYFLPFSSSLLVARRIGRSSFFCLFCCCFARHCLHVSVFHSSQVQHSFMK